MDNKHRLFVYGSLRKGFNDKAYQYIASHFTYLGEGKVKGKLFFNGHYPVAQPTDHPNYITGDLYELNNPADYTWVFSQLDDYEGLNTMPDEIASYRREPVKVDLPGSSLVSWIYWYNHSVADMHEISSGELAEFLKVNKL